MSETYWKIVSRQYKKSKIGVAALFILGVFFLIGLYAPLLASSKPLLVYWNHSLYSPLLRYIFYAGFYTKPIDLFFNLLMFTFPIALFGWWLLKNAKLHKFYLLGIFFVHFALFGWILSGALKNPESDTDLMAAKREVEKERLRYNEDPLLAPFIPQLSWDLYLKYLATYGRLNQLLNYKFIQAQHERLQKARSAFAEGVGHEMPTLWFVRARNEASKEEELRKALLESKAKYVKAREEWPLLMETYRPFSHAFIRAKYALEHAQTEDEKKNAEEALAHVVEETKALRISLGDVRNSIAHYQKTQGELDYLNDKRQWLKSESQKMRILIPPFIRSLHWEEDAGGAQEANQYLPWWELTRINRKDLVASLLFGVRISIVVGTLAVLLALMIGIPMGTIAGYFAGKTDLIICRIIEMWEAMPTFFMLLLIIAITQSKSIFLVVSVLGLFGWTGFSRFVRSEVLKLRKLPFVDACHSLGFPHKRIMFSHILPNAIPPVLTLLPFSMMAFITSEAGLSFLGLGEEGSTSWGVLMDEGRSVFPAESYLLWPPAILLTILLIAIALVGDALRDAIDPKMRG
jgi:peptide/nickel transport system permease protein